ncbi:MAG: hemerythrin domain-containing protein [Gammaproteobacteria bacterium]|nr:hemerythrin domain-containing protein [Gammaproteobacteria bacterium]
MTITAYMSNDHKSCDDIFTDMESAAHSGDWERATQLWHSFHHDLERHLKREEEQLFPAFEAQNGMQGGPTSVMRHEHEQMRGLMAQIALAVTNNDVDELLGQTETLLILMQQHNAKEEQVLYPMMDRVLGSAGEDIISTWK